LKPRYRSLVMISIILAILLAGTREGVVNEGGGKKPLTGIPEYQQVDIASIWQNPPAWEGRKIFLEGTYLGWKGRVRHPGITRSDWALKDGTGAIYITGRRAGRLDPLDDRGHHLRVWGTVHTSPKGVPYVAAEQVTVTQD
jgi:hypothetical protein